MSLTISHALSRCVTNRYSLEKLITYTENEITLKISSESEEELRQISKISICGYHCNLDWVGRLVNQPTGHSDPLFLIENGANDYSIQVIIYEKSIIDRLYQSDHSINVVTGENIYRSVPTKYINEYNGNEMAFDSDCVISEDIKINIDASEAFSLILQYVKFGRFYEKVYEYEAGKHVFPLPYLYADYYGVCISSNHAIGGLEHKHMIMGHLGAGSARHLMTFDNRILSPRAIAPYQVKSLIVHLTKENQSLIENTESLLKEYREIEFGIDASGRSYADIAEIVSTLEGISERVSYFVFYREGEEAFVDRIKGTLGSQFSFSLFQDVASPYYAMGLFRGSREHVWETSWVNSQHIYPAHGNSYGVGFSYYYDEKWPSPKHSTFDISRKMKRNIECSDCPKFDRCSAVLPYPISKDWYEDFLHPYIKEYDVCILAAKLFNRSDAV